MQRISKDLMEQMFEGNSLQCHCHSAKELDSTYQSAVYARNSFKKEMPERYYAISKTYTEQGGVVVVTRGEDEPAKPHGDDC